MSAVTGGQQRSNVPAMQKGKNIVVFFNTTPGYKKQIRCKY
jgi:hypothetical protein